MNFADFIKPELVILTPVLFALGAVLKKLSFVKDKYIPAILGAASVVLCIIWVFANSPLASGKDVLTAIFVAVTQGILCAGGSVYIDQTVFKQPAKEE